MHRYKLRTLLAAAIGMAVFLATVLGLRMPWHIATGNDAQLAIQQLDRMRPPMIRLGKKEHMRGAPTLAEFDRAAGHLREETGRYLILAEYNPILHERVEQFAAASESWLASERALWKRRLRLDASRDGEPTVSSVQGLEVDHRMAVDGFLNALEVLALGETPIHADIANGQFYSRWFQILAVMLILYLLGLIIAYQRSTRRELQHSHDRLEKARREIDQREEYLSRTLDSIGDGVITTDDKGNVLRMNPVAERLTGWSQAEARGKPLTRIFHIINARSREEVDNPVEKVLERGEIVGLANHTVLIARDGTEYQIADSGAPILDGKDNILGVILVFRDVTREYRLQEEIRRHRDELEVRVAERTRELESSNRELESFSYAVSHDLRAPLRAINGFAEALLDDNLDQLDATGQDYLHRVAAAARHMGELIDAMLKLSRVSRHEINYQAVDLTQFAHEITRDLEVLDSSRKVDWQIHPALQARGDPELLRAVVDNLLGNAWKYSCERQDGCRIEFGLLEQNDRRVFFVRDNGCGFDPRYADRLFVPFQRLHGKEFEGTGIGLATVYRIIRRHQGEIWAESRPGEGATFYFTLTP